MNFGTLNRDGFEDFRSKDYLWTTYLRAPCSIHRAYRALGVYLGNRCTYVDSRWLLLWVFGLDGVG